MSPQEDAATDRRVDLDQLVYGPEGPVGRVADVVIHPIRRTLTHVVIAPQHHHERARLIAVDALDMHDDATLHTALSDEEIGELPLVEERDYLRITGSPEFIGPWTVGITRVLAAPYYSLGEFGYDPYSAELGGAFAGHDTSLLAFDRIPADEVEIRRQSMVVDSDGEPVGHVEAFVTDKADQVTHVVVDGGHLWSHRETTVPIGLTRRVDNDRVELTCTRETLAELPSVPYHRHH